MPMVNGQFRHWWNYSARDPKNGKLKTFFVDGGVNIVTRDQMFAWARIITPYVDLTDFSCELTDKLPQNSRDCIPIEYRADPRQLELTRRLSGQATPAAPPYRSIFNGKQISGPQERTHHDSDRRERYVSKFHHD